MAEKDLDKDWFQRQLKVAEDATADWPDWMKREAGIPTASDRAYMAAMANACNQTARNMVNLTKRVEAEGGGDGDDMSKRLTEEEIAAIWERECQRQEKMRGFIERFGFMTTMIYGNLLFAASESAKLDAERHRKTCINTEAAGEIERLKKALEDARATNRRLNRRVQAMESDYIRSEPIRILQRENERLEQEAANAWQAFEGVSEADRAKGKEIDRLRAAEEVLMEGVRFAATQLGDRFKAWEIYMATRKQLEDAEAIAADLLNVRREITADLETAKNLIRQYIVTRHQTPLSDAELAHVDRVIAETNWEEVRRMMEGERRDMGKWEAAQEGES